MGGARITARREDRTVQPFAQLLVGGARFLSIYDSVSYFCWRPGAGVDIRATRVVALRMGADFRLIPTEFSTLRQLRLAAGIEFTK